MSRFDPQAIKNADDQEFTADEIEQLAKIHLIASWPVFRSALTRYQARAYAAITAMGSTIEQIRENQGRIDMAQQLLDLLEEVAPTRYKKKQEQDANDSESARK